MIAPSVTRIRGSARIFRFDEARAPRITTLPTVAVAVNSLDIIRDDARPRVSDFRHSKFAPSRRAGVTGPLTLTLNAHVRARYFRQKLSSKYNPARG